MVELKAQRIGKSLEIFWLSKNPPARLPQQMFYSE